MKILNAYSKVSNKSVKEILKEYYIKNSNLDFDLTQLDSKISNPENLTLLKEIINLSGLK